MNIINRNDMLLAAIHLLPLVSKVPLSELSQEEESRATSKAARIVSLLSAKLPASQNQLTTEAISDTPTTGVPEWIRLPQKGKCPYSGLSRSKIYELITPSEGNNHRPPVRSVSLRKKLGMKGTRLVHLESLLAYLRSMEQPNETGSQPET